MHDMFELLQDLDKAMADAREAWDILWTATKNNAPPEELATLQKVAEKKRRVSSELSDRVMNYIKNIEWLRRQNND